MWNLIALVICIFCPGAFVAAIIIMGLLKLLDLMGGALWGGSSTLGGSNPHSMTAIPAQPKVELPPVFYFWLMSSILVVSLVILAFLLWNEGRYILPGIRAMFG